MSRPQAPQPARPGISHRPWYREPFMWLVVGGPLGVVVAAFATLYIAISHPDPVLQASEASGSADVPAIEARNHAAKPKP